LNGDPNSPYYDPSGGHGNPDPNHPNYNDAHSHKGWKTVEANEEYQQRLIASGLPISSTDEPQHKHADGSLHYEGRATDGSVPHAWKTLASEYGVEPTDAAYYKLAEEIASKVGTDDPLDIRQSK
jgi:hypothetical protein